VLGVTRDWLRYRLPRRYVRRGGNPVCIGQKQKWFSLRLIADASQVRLDRSARPEFDGWRWVDYWQPIQEVVPFKREVYRLALDQLASSSRSKPARRSVAFHTAFPSRDRSRV